MHVSTAFVARHKPELADQPLTVRGPTAYVESKVGGENLLRTAGLGALTVRPSVVIGNSRTGEIRRAQGLHSMCGQVMRSEVPLLFVTADDPTKPAHFDYTEHLLSECPGRAVHSRITGTDHGFVSGNGKPRVIQTVSEWFTREFGVATERMAQGASARTTR